MSLYRERDPGGPFATLIAVSTSYLHPENHDLDSLKQLARRADGDEMRVFKRELREALLDPGQLPGGELSESVEYDDACDEAFLRRLWHELYGDEPLEAPRGLFDPDRELRELDSTELLAMVPRRTESVLLRGRVLMELARRASADTVLLRLVADIIRDPQNRRLITVGTASVSQLGTAGLIAGGSKPAAVLAGELASEWTADERSDFEWLMRSSASLGSRPAEPPLT